MGIKYVHDNDGDIHINKILNTTYVDVYCSFLSSFNDLIFPTKKFYLKLLLFDHSHALNSCQLKL